MADSGALDAVFPTAAPAAPLAGFVARQVPGLADVSSDEVVLTRVAVATLLSVLLVVAGCRRADLPAAAPAARLPQVAGSLTVDGVSAPVTILRDRSGIPHITAASQDDLFFAQGFVQAQDRLFQIDLWRRAAQGRLSEVLGANFIERDAATRRIQYRGSLEQEWASYGPDTQAIAAAFTRGINAWVAKALEQLPEEFALAGWKPELWRPEDLLNRTDAFVASADAIDEVFRAQVASVLGTTRTDRAFPTGRSRAQSGGEPGGPGGGERNPRRHPAPDRCAAGVQRPRGAIDWLPQA